jgi:RNA-binding protein YhbY
LKVKSILKVNSLLSIRFLLTRHLKKIKSPMTIDHESSNIFDILPSASKISNVQVLGKLKILYDSLLELEQTNELDSKKVQTLGLKVFHLLKQSSDAQVQIYSANCLVQIFRVVAPEAPLSLKNTKVFD